MHQNLTDLLDVPVLFGRFLILTGLLTETDIAEAVRVQQDLNAGPLFSLLERGLLSCDEVRRVRAHQRERMITFCEAMSALRILAPTDCAAAMEAAARERIRLGDVLVAQGKITRAALEEALLRHQRHQDSRSEDAWLGEAEPVDEPLSD
jgi:hypothetical protein